MLLQEECHKIINKTAATIEPMAFAKKWKGSNNMRQTTIGRKPYYYYGHCKIAGHSINRCFKIQCYPNKNKTHQGKKYVALANNEDCKDENTIDTQLGLNTKKYTNLLGRKENHNLERTVI